MDKVDDILKELVVYKTNQLGEDKMYCSCAILVIDGVMIELSRMYYSTFYEAVGEIEKRAVRAAKQNIK